MATITRMLDEVPNEKKKHIKFKWFMDDENHHCSKITDIDMCPCDFEELVLLYTNHNGKDVILARSEAGKSNPDDCIFIGKWRGGIVKEEHEEEGPDYVW